MIYVTGDKHGQIEPFETHAYKRLKKNDMLIICGDFGFVWDGLAAEQRHLKWLQKRKYQIAFLDGCYENFSLLSKYPEETYCSGRIRRIAPNIVWLQRGQLYEIEGKKLLVFGGRSSTVQAEFDDILWRREAEPQEPQIQSLIDNLKSCDGVVDAVLTHEPPLSIKSCLDEETKDYTAIHELLEELRKHATFSHWYFGKYHLDRKIPPSYRAVFNDLVPLGADEAF